MRSVADAVLAVLLAPRCLACDAALQRPTLGPVCAACWHSIRPIQPPVCSRCGDALSSWRTFENTGGCPGDPAPTPPAAGDEAGLCARCRKLPGGAVTIGRCAGEYSGALRQLVRALKYDDRRSLVAPLAALMRERGREVLAGADVAVPVPLHWRRRWQRGFNQAEALAECLGLPVSRALVRVRHTKPQFGLSAAQRYRNVKGALAPRGARWPRRAIAQLLDLLRVRAPGGPADWSIGGAVVVLVDDVATTGATLNACAEELMRMGAREVRTLTAARAPWPQR